MNLLRVAAFLLAASAAACASSGAVPKPFPGARTVPGGNGAPADTPHRIEPAIFDVQSLIRTALSFRGVPYRNGGSDPSGFDCSGFVQYVFAQSGLPLPREVREQFAFGERIPLTDIRAGDLIFFSTVAPGPSHVGVMVDGKDFVHAPSSRGTVRVERLDAGYWSRRVVAVKRLAVPPTR